MIDKDKVIQLAKEAGAIWTQGLNGSGFHINHIEDLERFAQAIYRQGLP